MIYNTLDHISHSPFHEFTFRFIFEFCQTYFQNQEEIEIKSKKHQSIPFSANLEDKAT